MPKYRVFSSPNTGKYGSEKTLCLDTFHVYAKMLEELKQVLSSCIFYFLKSEGLTFFLISPKDALQVKKVYTVFRSISQYLFIEL